MANAPTHSRRSWGWREASHLLRRAGFSASHDEIQRAVDDGLETTVDRLLSDDADAPAHDELDVLGERLAARNDIAALRAWWFRRMFLTTRPLRARLAVFWHGHFATSNSKVQSARLMLGQLRLFEELGLGPLEDMLLAVSRDPAMIIWLDGNANVKGRPNENYARELFELFALGVGNYSEADIKEAARAFTGWHERNGRFRFVDHAHDRGEKTVFGETGAYGGADIVRITVQHEACARFIALKLLREFLTPFPSDDLIADLAAHLRKNKLEIRSGLRWILTSDAMFAPDVYRTRIKSPVEYVVGLSRSLGVETSGSTMAEACSQMGQRLFEPPTVKGWDGHRAWMNSTTMLVRLNTAIAMRDEAVARLGAMKPGEAIDRFAAVTLDGNAPAALRDDLRAATTTAEVIELFLTAPEYQLA